MKSWEIAIVVIAVTASLIYVMRRIRLHLLGKAGCNCGSNSENKNCGSCSTRKSF